MAAGIVGSGVVPSLAIELGSPATLLTTSTPTAPAFCALRILVVKVHTPRSITTILPAWVPAAIAVQARVAALGSVAAAKLFQFASVALTAGLNGLKSPTAAWNVFEAAVTGIPKKWSFADAQAVIASAAWPGLSTVFAPGPELPAAIATTTPALAARLLATVSWSWNPLIPPPRLMLITSMPSLTASSIAWAMSCDVALASSPGKTL